MSGICVLSGADALFSSPLSKDVPYASPFPSHCRQAFRAAYSLPHSTPRCPPRGMGAPAAPAFAVARALSPAAVPVRRCPEAAGDAGPGAGNCATAAHGAPQGPPPRYCRSFPSADRGSRGTASSLLGIAGACQRLYALFSAVEYCPAGAAAGRPAPARSPALAGSGAAPLAAGCRFRPADAAAGALAGPSRLALPAAGRAGAGYGCAAAGSGASSSGGLGRPCRAAARLDAFNRARPAGTSAASCRASAAGSRRRQCALRLDGQRSQCS